MNIAIFKEVTTTEQIAKLHAESEKYTGLYVDMNIPEQRKYVKEQADTINQLLKLVDKKRIAESKRYKSEVEKEAADIVERLKIANLPFTLLIDEYKLERKKILDDEKRVIELRNLSIQKEDDHEMGLLINKTYEFDKTEQLRIATEESNKIKLAAEKAAEARQQKIQDDNERNRLNEENAKLANVELVKSVHTTIRDHMISFGIGHDEATRFIQSVARKELPLLTINY